ncbi:MAG: peptidylprolyl isomerase [Elusimicrobiaceae bacterium]|jgi:hypothetical protein
MNINKYIVPVCALALFCACDRKPENKVRPALAKVGGSYITTEEYNAKLKDISSTYKNYLATKNGRKQFLQILIREKLILSAAKASDIPSSPAFLDETKKAREEMEARYRAFNDYLLTKLWLDELRKNGTISVTDKEIEAYYKEFPYEISMRHILIGTQAEATQLLKQAKGSLATFTALAKTRSIDPETAAGGGFMPPFMVGESIPEIEQTANQMAVNTTEGVFKSKFGYHILHKDAERKLQLSDVKERIALILEKQKMDSYLKNLENKYKVEVLDENYNY